MKQPAPKPSDRRLLSSTREQNQIAVRVADDECPSAPRLRLERLRERHAYSLIFEEERFRIVECDRCRKQPLSVSKLGINARLVKTAEVQPRAVPKLAGVMARALAGSCELTGSFCPRSCAVPGSAADFLKMAEEEGRQRGCTRVTLNTMKIQAPGFYLKQGDEMAATLDCDPPGVTRYVMTKRLL